MQVHSWPLCPALLTLQQWVLFRVSLRLGTDLGKHGELLLMSRELREFVRGLERRCRWQQQEGAQPWGLTGLRVTEYAVLQEVLDDLGLLQDRLVVKGLGCLFGFRWKLSQEFADLRVGGPQTVAPILCLCGTLDLVGRLGVGDSGRGRITVLQGLDDRHSCLLLHQLVSGTDGGFWVLTAACHHGRCRGAGSWFLGLLRAAARYLQFSRSLLDRDEVLFGEA